MNLITMVLVIVGVALANFVIGYFLMKRPSQGVLAEYLYEAEKVQAPHIMYVGNIGGLVFFVSWERFQRHIRVVIWPLGWVVPVWFAVFLIAITVCATIWWVFFRKG